MKALLIGTLSALVGLAAAHALAQDAVWRPAGTPPAFQRVPTNSSAPVTLRKPVPIETAGEVGVDQTALLDRPTPVFRAKTLDPENVPQLLPVGPAADTSKQPGAVKPIGPIEPLAMPRIVDQAVAPAPEIVYTGRRRPLFSRFVDTVEPVPGDATITGGNSLDDCVCANTGTTCVIDDCEPCWGRRWREWAGSCDDPCCLQRPRLWIRGEYLLWDISRQHLPPLLTSEAAPIRGPGEAGVLPISPILFGEDEARDDVRSGGRISAGFWFPRRSNCGMDASFFMVGRRTLHAEASSDANGNPVLARPFLDANTGQEAAELVAYPGLVAGRISYDSTTLLWGVDANLRHRWSCGPRYWLDCFVGYRHLNLADTIDINEAITVIDGGNRFLLNDHFATRNSFNGMQLGFEGEMKLFRRWFVAGNVKVALGNVHQIVNIDGSTTFVTPGAPDQVGRGGLYALVSNIGRYERNEFAVAPEFGLKIGVDINEHWRVYAGYNLLYVSNVVRAGDQIDRTVNFTGMAPEPGNLNPAVVAPVRPAVLFRQSDFWAQGGQFGIEYHW